MDGRDTVIGETLKFVSFGINQKTIYNRTYECIEIEDILDILKL